MVKFKNEIEAQVWAMVYAGCEAFNGVNKDTDMGFRPVEIAERADKAVEQFRDRVEEPVWDGYGRDGRFEGIPAPVVDATEPIAQEPIDLKRDDEGDV